MAGKEIMLYGELLHNLKEKIKSAQQRAILAVNNELLSVYWEIGNAILQQQLQQGWGAKVIDQLATDLRLAFPEIKGFSLRNIKYMRAFAEAYPTFLQQAAANAKLPKNKQQAIVQAPLAQIEIKKKQQKKIVQVPLAQLSWYHHITLLDKVKDPATRYFYIQKTVDNGWSRNTLVHQIESGLHKTQGALVNNFSNTMPAYQSELTAQVFKDPYNFDFIMLGEQAKERDLEDALMTHVTKVLLELGAGFAFMGRQRRFEAGGREFFIDLLFYHTKLRRHIIIELKIGEFEPEYVSKMNLYLGLADDQLKGEYDEPAIGLILCKTNNKIIAEYALRDTSKPIGISEYKIAERLPDNIKGELPSIEEIEQRMDEGIKEVQSPIDIKLKLLKERISRLNTNEASKITNKAIKQVYEQFLTPFYNNLYNLWAVEIIPMFTEYESTFYTDEVENPFHTSADFELRLIKSGIRKLHISLCFKGFKKAGTNAFNIYANIIINFADFKYTIDLNNNTIIDKLYTQLPTEQETKEMEDKLTEYILDIMKERIDSLI